MSSQFADNIHLPVCLPGMTVWLVANNKLASAMLGNYHQISLLHNLIPVNIMRIYLYFSFRVCQGAGGACAIFFAFCFLKIKSTTTTKKERVNAFWQSSKRIIDNQIICK